jgi:hypothetical protein
MALIACPECGTAVSTQARSCPQCGAPTRHKGTKWWLWGPLGLFSAFLGCGAIVGSTPEGQARTEERRLIEQCMADMKDPVRSADFREAARWMCERLRDDYVKKHGQQP